jgi:hypothetical protein
MVHSDHASATYGYTTDKGVSAWFDPGDDIADEIANALIEMHELMDSSAHSPWNTVRFAVERHGEFHVEYTYDPGT